MGYCCSLVKLKYKVRGASDSLALNSYYLKFNVLHLIDEGSHRQIFYVVHNHRQEADNPKQLLAFCALINRES